VTYELSGEAAPPMVNGELVFEAPWQGRIFGMARGLAEQGIYAWDEFRMRLIDEVGSFAGHEIAESGLSTPQFHYYDHFLRALETLLVQRGIVAPGELTDRVRALADRPPGHDHHEGHNHDGHDQHPAHHHEHHHDHADDHP
jgi:nitrile hydratase accessory protein